MRKINKIINIALIFMLIGVCQEAYALRVPMNGHKKVEEALKETLANLPTYQLIREATMSMPRWNEEKPDWNRFNEIISEIRKRKDVNIIVYVGRQFNNEGEVDADDKNIELIPRFASNKGQKFFILHILHNVHQHVRSGIALVARQEIETKEGDKYIEISVSDNGAGPIDRDGERAPIEEVLNYGKTIGKGGSRGQGLSFATKIHASLSAIHVPGSSVVVGKLPNLSKGIIFQEKNKKTHGMAVIGYFLEETSNLQNIREDIIRRSSEYIQYTGLGAEEIANREVSGKTPLTSNQGVEDSSIKKEKLKRLSRIFPYKKTFVETEWENIDNVEYYKISSTGLRKGRSRLLSRDESNFYDVKAGFVLVHKDIGENDVIGSTPFWGCANVTIKGEKDGKTTVAFMHSVSIRGALDYYIKMVDKLELDNPYVFFDVVDSTYFTGKIDREEILETIASSTQTNYSTIYKAKVNGNILIDHSGREKRETKIIATKDGIALKLKGQSESIAILFDEIKFLPLETSASSIAELLRGSSRSYL